MACSFGEALFIFTGAAAAVARRLPCIRRIYCSTSGSLPMLPSTNPRSSGREQFRTKISRFIVSLAAML